jgi:hypothetical protein
MTELTIYPERAGRTWQKLLRSHLENPVRFMKSPKWLSLHGVLLATGLSLASATAQMLTSLKQCKLDASKWERTASNGMSATTLMPDACVPRGDILAYRCGATHRRPPPTRPLHCLGARVASRQKTAHPSPRTRTFSSITARSPSASATSFASPSKAGIRGFT